MASGVSAALGAVSGIATVRQYFETPESFLNDWLPRIAEQLAIWMGYSDLHAMAPWWARDLPAIWMLPVSTLLLWLLTASCRPRAATVAASFFASDQQKSLEMRAGRALVEVHHAELKTPSRKEFTKQDLQAAQRTAHAQVVTQQAADLLAAQSAYAEHAAFLEESRVEYGVLRFEVVTSYVLGFVSAYFVGPYGLFAVPFLALGLPLTIFLVLVAANVATQWTVYCCQRQGCCLPDETYGARAWSLNLRDTRAGEWLSSLSSSLVACCSSCRTKTGPQFWGVTLRDVESSPPPKTTKNGQPPMV